MTCLLQGRLSYYIGGETMTLCHLEHPMYMLGYLPKEDRVYLMDKQQNIYSYRVRRAMLQYQVFTAGMLYFFCVVVPFFLVGALSSYLGLSRSM